jgi:hypothetical protein
MIKKTENFQNFDSVKIYINKHLQYIIPIIIIILYIFFPKVLLIVNSIYLLYIIYWTFKFFTMKGAGGSGLILILFLFAIIVCTILEIHLLYGLYNLTEPEPIDFR